MATDRAPTGMALPRNADPRRSSRAWGDTTSTESSINQRGSARITTFGNVGILGKNISRTFSAVFEDSYILRLHREYRLFRRVCWAVPYVSGKLVKSCIFSGITTILTIYALFGDDFRLLLTPKPMDWIFDCVTLTTLFIFAFEVVICTFGKSGYVFGFFFWLDIMATCTIVLDVTKVSEALFGDSISSMASAESTGANGQDAGSDSADAARAARMSRVGSKAGRVVRLIRLVRLIRFVKLYKRTQSNAPQPDIPFGDEDDDNHVSESAVSRKLSEMTTRRVIMLVLVIMLALPFFEPTMYTAELPSSAQYGVNHLFRLWHHGLTMHLPTANATQCVLYLRSPERADYVDDFFMYIFYHNPYCTSAQIPDGALASPMDMLGRLFWVGTSARPTEALADFFLPRLPSGSLGGVDMSERWGGASWPMKMCSLPEAALAALDVPWSRTEVCLSGKFRGVSLLKPQESRLDCPDTLRFQERSAVYSTMATSSEWKRCFFMFVFDRRSGSEFEAVLNMLQTIWICFLLGFGAMTFSNDANRFVLSPIERMISKIDKIRNNPLAALTIGDEEQHREQVAAEWATPLRSGTHMLSDNISVASSNHESRRYGALRRWWLRLKAYYNRKSESPEPMETVILEKTIIKIGSLLALGFGEAGAEIIGQNMKGESSSTLNAMVPGRRVDAIFGFCDIRNFMDTTEVLQDQVMVFVNKLASVVHSCTNEYFGSPNKNIGNAFLLAWRLSGHSVDKQERLADMALVAIVKIIAQINKSTPLAEYRTHPKLLKRLPNYHVQMGFGLHSGWAIEGAIGSEFKIDASYLSPHVNLTARVESATKLYDCLVLVSDAHVRLMSEPIRVECRLIDHVWMEGTRKPIKLYTLDLDDTALTIEPPKKHELSSKHRVRHRLELQRKKQERWSDDFVMGDFFAKDPDIVKMRNKYTTEFFARFKMAYLNYEAGEWPVAHDLLEVTRRQLGPEDGPSVALLRFMRQYGYVAPKTWPGWRTLTEKVML